MAFWSLACKLPKRASRTTLRLCSRKSPDLNGLVLGVYQDGTQDHLELSPTADTYNTCTNGRLLEQIRLAGNRIKAGKSLLFWGLDERFQATAVVGLGKRTIASDGDDVENLCEQRENVRIAAAAGCRALEAVGVRKIAVETLCDPESTAEGSLLSLWQFQEYKTKKAPVAQVVPFEFNSQDQCLWDRGLIKAEAQNLARKLADTPSNFLTPTIFGEMAREVLNSATDCQVQVHDEEWIRNEKMGALLAVTRGSQEAPRFLEISYGNAQGQPIVLIGKGVTFDSGGISIKPSASMDEMRADMGGGATVLATIHALSRLQLEANIKVLVPLTENMPSGAAIKPGDVIRARNGKTIAVDNTDAEGRLILADALAYSAIYRPRFVLDIATLTGAIRVALGGGVTGVFANSNGLYGGLEAAAAVTGDRVWRMPLWQHYSKLMTEYSAYDVNNVGKGKGGGSCKAAAFLREFVPEKTPWLHLDMAAVCGPGDLTPYLSAKGMTGRPTRTLVHFIEEQLSRTC